MRREVSVQSLKDDHVYPFQDHGVDRDGVPHPQRQSLIRNLGKRCKDTGMPIYRVIGVSDWRLFGNEVLPTSDEFRLFDDNYLGEGSRPNEKWLEQRAKNITKAADSMAEAKREMERKMNLQLADQIGALTQSLAKGMTPPAAPVVRPK
jgi:hypothetical protein